jgi:Cu/Ag efflux pump CusA
MTSLAFIFGVVPLAVATGAGSEMRQSLGVAVFAGMLGVTLFGLLFTLVFYTLARRVAAVVQRPQRQIISRPEREEEQSTVSIPAAGSE